MYYAEKNPTMCKYLNKYRIKQSGELQPDGCKHEGSTAILLSSGTGEYLLRHTHYSNLHPLVQVTWKDT